MYSQPPEATLNHVLHVVSEGHGWVSVPITARHHIDVCGTPKPTWMFQVWTAAFSVMLMCMGMGDPALPLTGLYTVPLS